MQSIYRFRDADVSIFGQCWEDGLPNVSLEPIRLRANFRSSRELVDWNNDLFGRLFPQSALPKLGAIPFSPAVAQKPSPTPWTIQLSYNLMHSQTNSSRPRRLPIMCRHCSCGITQKRVSHRHLMQSTDTPAEHTQSAAVCEHCLYKYRH